MEKHAFEFLKEDYPKIEKFCYELEQSIVFKNFRNVFITGRIISEKIVEELLYLNALNSSDFEQKDRIELLKTLNILEEDEIIEEKIFRSVSKMGNYAAHGALDEIKEKHGWTIEKSVYWIHKAIYYITGWFYRKTINENFVIKDYPGIFFKKEMLTEEIKPKLCKKCNGKIMEGDNFCRECGTKVESDYIYCYNCGTSVHKDEIICPNCNFLLDLDNEEIANFCEKCGTKLNIGAPFCPECGHKIIKIANDKHKEDYFVDFLKENPYKYPQPKTTLEGIRSKLKIKAKNLKNDDIKAKKVNKP